jgi:hypothetical protein
VRRTTQEADASEVFPTHEQSMGTSIGMKDSRVDAYIIKADDFAKPILTRLRATVHAACPSVKEGLKWKYQG